MSPDKEQIVADLVWRYVEQVRAREADGSPVSFSRRELEQLVQILETAGAVPEALAGEAPESARACVRSRVEQALRAVSGEPLAGRAAPSQAPASRLSPTPASPGRDLSGGSTGPRRAGWWAGPLPFWCAAGVASALAAALALVNVWHRPPVQVVRMPVPREIADVQPLDEAQVHRLIPRMVKNELPPQQEKNVMGHMLVCPGCFDAYVQLKQTGQSAQRRPERFTLTSWR